MTSNQNRAFNVSIPIDVDERDRRIGRNRPVSPPLTHATDKILVRKDSKTKEELWLPVAYHAVSAEVQNEIDRMSVADLQENQGDVRGRTISFTAAVSNNEQDAVELVNQMSIQRKQTRDFRRQVYPPSEKNGQMAKGEHAMEAAFQTPPIHKRSEAKRSTRDAPGLDVVKDATADDHLISLQECERRFDTNMARGLTEEQVIARRLRDGKNVLSPPRTTPVWLAFLKCLIGGFGIVLWAAFILCILAYEPLGAPTPDIYNIILALVILVVILAQAIFFFLQERRSSNLMASFANMLPTYCNVIREGHIRQVDASELVVGDVVEIKAGDKVPADMRLFKVNQGKVEKSGLTGESEPIPLSVTSSDPNMYETKNLALFGTSLLEGSASGMVINTADRTVMGKIARVASGTSSVSTSLQKEVNYFTGLVAAMAVIVCIIVVLGYYLGVDPAHPGLLTVSSVIGDCIAVVVSLLPEGTPVALALILTMIAKRMYEVKILVKKLTVLETLGSATLIASDKTGTLTQNRMTLNHLWIVNDYKGGQTHVEEEGRKKSTYEKHNPLDNAEKSGSGCFGARNVSKHLSEPALNYLCQMMCLCNKTVFEDEDENQNQSNQRGKGKNDGPRKIVGNPTEGALLNAADEYLDTAALREATPIIKEIAFSSRTKYHLTIHQVDDPQLFQNSQDAIRPNDRNGAYSYVIFLKGAPEYVLGMCTKAVVNGEEVLLEAPLVHRIMKANELLAGQGERVLAFAYRKLNSRQYPEHFVFDMEDEEQWTSDLCFLGLTGIIDPPREGVADSIIVCHNAHVRVMMVTGDQPATAVAIARAVNIITHQKVKTVADVEYNVPYSADDIYEENKEKQCMSKFKQWLKGPPKRYFKNESIVVAGNEISTLTKKQWDFVLEHREVVFARTTPQQKLQIVKESRKRGDVVAVTGDGVNDAPALKAADLGVAMGICGSDVSKEAANMILLDDNFVTIVKGIKEGRLLFDNLKKVICYLFPNGSFSEILPVLANVFLGMPMPLSTFLMIIICIGSDMIGSLGLIHELAESDIMNRPPRNARTDRLVNPRTILFAYFFVGIMESTIAFFMYFYTMSLGGVSPSQLLLAFDKWNNESYIPHLSVDARNDLNCLGQSAFFVSLVMTQLWNLLSVRTRYQSIFTQKFQLKLFFYMLGEVAVVLCMVYFPVIQDNMHTKPVEYYHFLIPLGMGSIILVCDEIRKFFVRKFPKGILAKLAW